jgi:hypothetical protein
MQTRMRLHREIDELDLGDVNLPLDWQAVTKQLAVRLRPLVEES